jgi:hypothetical protein
MEVSSSTAKESAMPSKSLMYAVLLSAVPLSASADLTVPMNLVNEKGLGESLGQVTVSQSKYGLVFTPSLANLPSGLGRRKKTAKRSPRWPQEGIMTPNRQTATAPLGGTGTWAIFLRSTWMPMAKLGFQF